MNAFIKFILLSFSFMLLLSETCLAQSEMGGAPRSSSGNSMMFRGSDFSGIMIDFAVIAGIYLVGKKMPKDKRYHLYAGALTGRVASIWCGARSGHKTVTERRKRQFLCSFGAASVVGVMKEVYDSTGRGTVDFKDAVVTGLGGAAMGVRYL